MNNKITTRRFKNFITYDLWKTIIVTVVVVYSMILLLQIISPKPSYGQKVTLLVDDAVNVSDEGLDLLESINDTDIEEYGFSYEVLDTSALKIKKGDYSSSYMLNMYEESCFNDVFVSADVTTGKYSLFDNYIANNYGVDLIEYINDSLEYCKRFFNSSGTINKQEVSEYFYETRSKDARFRKDSAYIQGVEDECRRIIAIKNNALKLQNLFQTNPDIFYYKELTFDDENTRETKTVKGYYGIHLGKLEEFCRKDKNIKNVYSRVVENEDGSSYITSDKVILSISDNKKESGDLHYEGLTVLTYFIYNYTTLLD